MKLNKKFLACFTAATLAVSPMTAFAETYDIVGDGIINYFDDEIYNVILPTDDSITFTVDPDGVLGVTNGTMLNSATYSSDTVTSSATAVINKSSVKLDVNVAVYLSAGAVSNDAVKIGTAEEVAAGTKDLYLAVKPMSGASLTKNEAITEAALSGSAGTTSTVVSGVAADVQSVYTLSTAALAFASRGEELSEVAITATSAALANTLGATLNDIRDAYYITDAGTNVKVAVLSEAAVTYDKGNVFGFQIVGSANPDSEVWEDMSDAGGKLALSMVFTITKHVEKVEVEEEVPYVDKNAISASDNTIALREDVVLSSIILTNASGATNTWKKGTQYTLNASTNVVTIGSTYINNNVGGYITLTFADGHTEQITMN